jgi:hypothetical protein
MLRNTAQWIGVLLGLPMAIGCDAGLPDRLGMAG